MEFVKHSSTALVLYWYRYATMLKRERGERKNVIPDPKMPPKILGGEVKRSEAE